jgi:transcriptional regulator with XRE-family HTH domain
MSVKAVAAYFDRHIELRGLKIGATLEAAGGFGPNYLSRVMSGATKAPGAVTLRRIAAHIGASWEVVGRLLDSEAYDISDGREAAEDPVAWLARHTSPDVAEVIMHARGRDDSARIADELEDMAKRIRAGLE